MQISRSSRIVMVCDGLLDKRSAQTIHVLELFNNLSKLAEVYLFTPKQKDIKFKSSTIKYIPRPGITKLGLIFYQIILFLKLFFYCKKMGIDAIYVREFGFSFSPLIISKLFGIPYFVEINGLIVDEMKMYNSSKIYIEIKKLSEKFDYKHAKKIIAVTEGVKEGVKELYNIPDEKIVVIENGANTDLFNPMDQKEARKKLEFDQDANYVCFVGALAPWQGVEYLIQSAPLILKEIKNTKFIIIGNGQMKKELVNLAEKTGVSDKFIFTGIVPYEEVPKCINASNVCVAPFIRARNERIGLSPLKIYEYLACGKPVVSSRIPNLEFIEKQNVGTLVEPENPDELAKVIIKLLKDEKLRDEMGKNGREYVVKNHSWEAVARKVAEVCKSAVKEHKNKRI